MTRWMMLTAAVLLAGCSGYRADEVRFNDALVTRAALLAELAKEDAAADAAMLHDSPAADGVRSQLARKAELADQLAALAAALYQRTHQRTLTPEELAVLIRTYKEQDPWQKPTTRPAP